MRRIALLLVTLLGVALVTFAVVYAVPADPAQMVAGPYATAATIASIRHQLGLDQPVYVQFIVFLVNALHGNLGQSFMTQEPVAREIAQRFPATLQLGLAAFVVQLMVGIPVGVVTALRPHSRLDRALTAFLLLGLALPRFWVGVVFLFVFAFELSWFPLGGYGGISHLVLPACTVGLTGAAVYARLLRASMLDVAHHAYVTTARAKGLSGARVVIVHIMRNALIPVITWAGIDLAGFLSGLLVVEAVFGWPGLGQLTFQAIQNLDIPTITGVVLFAATLVLVANLVVDVLYGMLDRRIVYS